MVYWEYRTKNESPRVELHLDYNKSFICVTCQDITSHPITQSTCTCMKVMFYSCWTRKSLCYYHNITTGRKRWRSSSRRTYWRKCLGRWQGISLLWVECLLVREIHISPSLSRRAPSLNHLGMMVRPDFRSIK